MMSPFFSVRESLRIQSGYFGLRHNDDWIDELLANLGSLQKRLGGYRATLLQKVMADALMAHANGKPEAHRQWIRVLLKDYYDPMYAYQLGLKSERVVFKGDYDAVMAYCADCRIR
jgi:tRNA 2-selenouridine synthase